MAQSINTNVASLNAQRNLGKSANALSTTLQRLSSGLRINSAKDDAAGLAISERFTSQIRGMNQAARNANDGISMAQTAEGALGETSNMLQRIRELAIQSANATNSAGDRAALNAEVQSLTAELQRTATTTQFNGQNILDGSFTSAQFQVGANANQTITATSGNFQTNAYGNYRIGGLAVFGSQPNGVGDLVPGSAAEGKLTTFATGNSSGTAGSDITISNSLGTKTITTADNQSAEQIAAAINKADTGVKASAITSFVLGADDAGAGAAGFEQGTTYSFQVATDTTDGADPSAFTTVSFTVGGTSSGTATSAASQLNAAVQAFNDISGKTGFTAKIVETDGGQFGIQLTSEAGKDLRLSNISGAGVDLALEDLKAIDGDDGNDATAVTLTGAASNTAWVGATSQWISGQVILDSDRSFSLTTSAADNGITATADTFGGQLQSIDNIDVSTVDAANRTLAMVDSALASVNSQRSRYGALQNRLESTIANLQTASENASAANSRIRDADFAAESANLTKGQIMQQAGTAMLAQANQLPQQVLSLIR